MLETQGSCLMSQFKASCWGSQHSLVLKECRISHSHLGYNRLSGKLPATKIAQPKDAWKLNKPEWTKCQSRKKRLSSKNESQSLWGWNDWTLCLFCMWDPAGRNSVTIHLQLCITDLKDIRLDMVFTGCGCSCRASVWAFCHWCIIFEALQVKFKGASTDEFKGGLVSFLEESSVCFMIFIFINVMVGWPNNIFYPEMSSFLVVKLWPGDFKKVLKMFWAEKHETDCFCCAFRQKMLKRKCSFTDKLLIHSSSPLFFLVLTYGRRRVLSAKLEPL